MMKNKNLSFVRKTNVVKLVPYLWLILVSIPPLLVLLALDKFVVNMPYADEWEMTFFMFKLESGGITWGDLWLQHNEHRIFFLRLIILGLYRIKKRGLS